MPRLLFVVGPTACGKSDFAVEYAELLERASQSGADIINCDSVQFFQGVDIGAAKPSSELLNRARHHLVGHVPLGGEYTAGDFRREALRVIETRVREGRLDFAPVGGSGFYVQALEKGMYEVPSIDEAVRSQLEVDLREGGLGSLYEELKARDPGAVEKIHAADQYRIMRALEILRSAPEGSTLTEIRTRFEARRPTPPFRVKKIGLFRPRDILRKRVTERTKAMLKAGLLDEVEALRRQGLSQWAPMLSVGYREVQHYLDGTLAKEELESAIVTSTMQLAKRQMTWFKRDPEILWFDTEQGFDAPLSAALQIFQT